MRESERYEKARDRLEQAEQEHVLGFWDELDARAREDLLAQLEGTDLELLEKLHQGVGTVSRDAPRGAREPAKVLRIGERPRICTREEAVERGENLLASGKAGLYLVAGGQGSRLGFEGPKGCLPVGPLSGRTLFELHAGKIRKLREKHGAPVPWYIMTSRENDAATRDFFASKDFFGLPPEDVTFMPQAMLPALDDDGKLILETKGKVFESPNGHGGAYAAFAKEGGLADAEARGIHHIFYFQVDNPLVRIGEPLYLGLHDIHGAEMSLKVVEKTAPEEKIGVVAIEGGRPRVIEYSDLSGDEAALRDDEGRLVYWAGNIAVHVFRLSFMRRIAEGDARLPYHVARKEIPAVDPEGKPATIRGRKFETFVFDALPLAETHLALEAVREEEFAPIKNAEGVDSIETGRALLIAEHRRWLGEIGIEARGTVEVSPYAALGPGDLEGLAPWRGKTFEGDVRVEVVGGEVRLEAEG